MDPDTQNPEPTPAETMVYITFVTADGVVKKAIPQSQAESDGLLEPDAYNLIGSIDLPKPKASGRSCPVCGLTQKDFEKRGRLGCPECYRAFEDVLPSILKRMHRGSLHVGKVPRDSSKEEVLKNRLQYLEKELQDAIRNERFEDAAELRDQIRDLEVLVQ